jgi:PTS system nitrogen regulatory IIA component
MYLNSVELAESFGVSEKVVADWIRNEALPHVEDRGRLLFDRARVAHWAAEHGLTSRAGFLAPENGHFTTGLELAPMLRSGGIWRAVPPSSAVDVLEQAIAKCSKVSLPVRAFLRQRLRMKGALNWAPVGRGFALPHFSTRVTLGREGGLLCLLLLSAGLPVSDPPSDSVPITRLFFFIPPSPRAHLDILARLSRGIAQGDLREVVERGGSDEEIARVMETVDAAGAPEKGDKAA